MPVIAEYNFDEGTGASVADVSGNGHGLTRGPNGTWVQGYHGSFAIRSRPQHTGETAGSGAYGAFPGGPPGAGSLTFLFWAKAPTLPDGWSAYLGVLNDYDGDVFGITVNSDGEVEADWVSDTGDHTPAATSITAGLIGLDEWVHIAGVFQPGIGATLYVNGVVATTYNWQAGSSAFKNAWTTLLVGGHKWGSGGACIDDLRIYNEALSQAQIAALIDVPAGETPGETINQLRLGNQSPAKLYMGAAEAVRAYLGSTLVYGGTLSGEPPSNASPTASFTMSQSGLGVTTNASASADSDGTIVGYSWDWGDTTTSTGVNGSHTYAADGSYTILLTVTDNQGATGTYSRPVTVSSGGFVPNLINNPSSGGYPDATNTGVPAGMTLTNSGPITVTTNGAVIQNLNIVNGNITVNANNVTIRNCRITTYDYYPIENNGTNLLVEDCEITGTDPNVAAAISFSNYTARRLHVSGSADGFKANANCVIEDCYVHSLAVTQDSHNDGIQSTGGNTVTVRHNTIDTNTDGVAVQFGSTNTGWLITDNLIRASGWALNGNAGTSSCTVTNNRFAPVPGWYGAYSLGGSGNTYSGNYRDDTGAAI